MNLCLHNLWLTTAEYHIDLRVIHIRGKDNDLVDALIGLIKVKWGNLSP